MKHTHSLMMDDSNYRSIQKRFVVLTGIRYFSLDEAWYGIAVSMAFRVGELVIFGVGKVFMAAWKKEIQVPDD